MTDQDNLRDRIEAVILRATDDGVDPAQAIIDEFGLHYVDSEEYAQVGLDWIEVEKGRHVVGKWEKQ